MAISAEDELRHQPTDEESWRESMWFCWQMPEHEIGSSMSFNYRPNTSQPGSNLRIAICRGLESENNKPLYSRHEQPPLPEGDFDDFAFPPHFRMQRIGPLQGFRMQFDDRERLSFDYEIRFFAGAFPLARRRLPDSGLSRQPLPPARSQSRARSAWTGRPSLCVIRATTTTAGAPGRWTGTC